MSDPDYIETITKEVREAVETAADAMDRTFPGWHRKVNLDILDMGSTDRCILGQGSDTRRFYAAFVLVTGQEEVDPTIREFPKWAYTAFSSHRASAFWAHEIASRRARPSDGPPASLDGTTPNR
jgi:hypothetical protein